MNGCECGAICNLCAAPNRTPLQFDGALLIALESLLPLARQGLVVAPTTKRARWGHRLELAEEMARHCRNGGTLPAPDHAAKLDALLREALCVGNFGDTNEQIAFHERAHAALAALDGDGVKP